MVYIEYCFKENLFFSWYFHQNIPRTLKLSGFQFILYLTFSLHIRFIIGKTIKTIFCQKFLQLCVTIILTCNNLCYTVPFAMCIFVPTSWCNASWPKQFNNSLILFTYGDKSCFTNSKTKLSFSKSDHLHLL